jgi:hypothetical protein
MGAYRFATKRICPETGSILHGLPGTPDEYFIARFGTTAAYLVAASAPDASRIYVTGAGASAMVSIFAAVNHSIMK